MGKSSISLLRTALSNKKSGFMLIFGFTSGLPFSLFLGTLYAWFTEVKIDLATMGVFSLIGLAYAFQFLWSPLVDKLTVPGFHRLGRRKQWILPSQIIVGVVLVLLGVSVPSEDTIGWFALLAGIGAVASATQDIAINAWRIDVADDVATLDVLSTIYQMGYRLAALFGGALALVIAARIGWSQTYLILGVVMLVASAVALRAPETSIARGPDRRLSGATENLYGIGSLNPGVRWRAVWGISALWAVSISAILIFMIMSFALPPQQRPDPSIFTLRWGPVIIVATVVIPGLVAGWLVAQRRQGKHVLASDLGIEDDKKLFSDHLYRALLLPLVDLAERHGWSLALIIALVLTYRICDAVWGSFAYPFYLGELGYTNDEVAFASKFFGVGAVIAGLAIGGILLTTLGRMFTLTLGAVLAALTNLLYADLAVGGANMQAFSDGIGFTLLIENLIGGSPALSKLTLTIALENGAIGIAGAAYIAWLSSIVSKEHSAVQYALLSSLTLLLGTIGRGALGEMIELRGYYDVFVFTTLIGVVAVILCLAEWFRSRNYPRAALK